MPYIVEGNTRVAVASDIGKTEIRAEIRWYNGGEQEPGPFSLAEGNSLPFCREEDDNPSPSP